MFIFPISNFIFLPLKKNKLSIFSKKKKKIKNKLGQ